MEAKAQKLYLSKNKQKQIDLAVSIKKYKMQAIKKNYNKDFRE